MDDRYDQAQSYLKKIADTFRSISGEESLDMSDVIGYTGDINMKMGKYQEAEECYMQVLDIRQF